jgi:hypothetical protein
MANIFRSCRSHVWLAVENGCDVLRDNWRSEKVQRGTAIYVTGYYCW